IGAGALAASELGRAPAGGGFLSAPQEWLEYLAHATIQEIGARGIIQSAIVRFLGPDRVVEALLLVSATFGVVHMHLGLGVAALTAVASLAFSALYHRHGSLVGVVLVHFLLGGALKALGVM
ncbi:MAG TPA: CPBP family intramembrane metalloprotease, partial [Myxococcota bacterium]|nr:CPBP family intramembrane metalloprotease [Myxococcota bacterium]